MTYDILLTKRNEKFVARVREWPEVVAEGATEEQALIRVQDDLKLFLKSSRVVTIDLDIEPEAHPWAEFAGMFADDPDWAEFEADMARYRQEIDNDGKGM